MACERYAIYASDAGRKVTQPLHGDGEPPRVYVCKDGTELPLVMVMTYPIPTFRAVGPLSAEVKDDIEAMQARVRARNARLYGKAVA